MKQVEIFLKTNGDQQLKRMLDQDLVPDEAGQ